MSRRLLPAFASVAVLLTGCATIVSDSGTQPGGIGPVRLTAHVCVGQGSAGDCTGYQTDPTATAGAQEMVAVRVPAGLTLPAGLTVGPYTLTANQSYTDALTAQYAPPSGEEWHGYATAGAVTGTAGTPYDITVDVPLPVGAPYSGPLKGRIVTGYRTLGIGQTGAEPFDCGTLAVTTHCAYSPSDPTVDHQYATRDLTVATGNAATAQAGSTATVSFPVRFRGASGPTFAQTAATTLSGATATPGNATVTPGADEDRTENVKVAIPADATPGDYVVTLTDATGGQMRSGTATLTVTPAAKPTVTPTVIAKPTVTAAPTAQPTPFAKVAPASFTASVKPRRDKRKPYRFTVKGRLGRPSGIGQDGVTCAGKVKVTARRFGISVGSATTTVQTSCAYSVKLTVKKKGRIGLETRFAGNAVFTPKSAKALKVRTG